MSYWLMKSEPTSFSIEALQRLAPQAVPWDGVRNYQARNMMRDEMQVGDQAFFYHSNAEVVGIAGVMRIVSPSYPDATQFNPESHYYDSKATPAKPIWYLVDVQFEQRFTAIITLAALRANPLLTDLWILRPGNRLSITPLSEEHWQVIMAMAT